MAEFAQVLIRAKDETKTAFDSASKNMRGLQADASRLNGLLGAIGVGVSVAGLAAFAKSGIDAADALNDMSQRTGVAVKTLADYKLAATQADTSLDSLAKGIQKLTLSIGQAEAGGKAQAQALKTLGVTARDPQQAFEQLAEAVANSNDPIKTNAALNDVLGRSYTELLPLLQGGAKGLRDSAAASASFSDAMVKLAPDASKFNNQLDALENNTAGLSATVLSKVLPSFNEWIATMNEVIKTGTLLDKVRFFGLGNASDEMVRRVRISSAATAGWADRLRESAANAGAKPEEDNAAKLACVADGGTWDGKRCIKKPTGGGAKADPLASLLASTDIGKLKEFDKQVALLNARFAFGRKDADLYAQAMTKLVESSFSDSFRDHAKAMEEEAETQKMVADHLKATTDELRAQDQAWIDAGKAIEEQYKPGLVQLEDRLGYLDELFRRNLISAEALSAGYADAFDSVGKSTDKAASEMDAFAKKFAENAQDTFADFFKNFDKGTDGMLRKFGETVKGLVAEAAAADLARYLFGDAVKGGKGSGVAGSLLSGLGELLSFDGGGYTGYGARTGGLDGKGGFLSVIHPNETVVDHSKGQSVGGGGPSIVQNFYGYNNAPEIKRAAGQGARQVLGMLSGAQRYS